MKWVLIIAALLGASSVMIGATLRHIGGDINMDVIDIALRYHQLYSIVLLVLGFYALHQKPGIRLIITCTLFSLGIVIFSFSLYASVLLSMPMLGHLTPIGGIMLIAGWLSFIALAFKNKTTE